MVEWIAQREGLSVVAKDDALAEPPEGGVLTGRTRQSARCVDTRPSHQMQRRLAGEGRT